MAEPVQNYKNHARFFPLFHFVAAPILLGNFLLSIWRFYRTPTLGAGWGVIFAFGLVAALLAARLMALTVQDRVIRLEMQMRLARVLTPDLLKRTAALTRGDFVALRFASDEELPDLVREVCDGQLKSGKEIKLRVKNWQGDFLRA
jgi:hypothetical protein